MQPIYYAANDRQQQQIPQENYVRVLGRFLGKVITTIAAVAGVRMLQERYAQEEAMHGGTQDAQTNLSPLAAQPENADLSMMQKLRKLMEQIRNDAALAVTAVVTWNLNIGGGTGADVLEYAVNRVGNFTTQNINESSNLPIGAVTIVDRVTDNLLWRFTNYANERFPQVREYLQPTERREMPRYRF